MYTWDKIIGHAREKAELRAMVAGRHLPHALLFTGAAGIGKRLVAETLAATLLCERGGDAPCGVCRSCRELAAGSHPDYYEVAPDFVDDKGALVHPKIIKIDEIRAMNAVASRYSTLGRGRVILIDEADRMNEPAANSLLKTLEEPAGEVTFILITTSRTALLDTIISRTMPVAFGMLQPEDMTAALTARGIAAAEATALATLAGGSIGRALLLHEHGGLAARDSALALLEGLDSLDMAGVWQLTNEKAELERTELDDFFLYLNMLLRDMLLLYEDGASPLIYHTDVRGRLAALLARYSEARVFSLLALVRDMQRRLQANVNVKLQLEGFFIRMRDL